MKKLYTIVVIGVFFLILSCSKEERNVIDQELIQLMSEASATGDYKYYILPNSDDYASLPNQDPNNPVTKSKVELGRLLFFETGLAQIPMNPNCKETYSCGTCHIASAGFLPGRIQGIADGGIGYGNSGDLRMVQVGYEPEDLDAQGTRPMNPMNSGYSTNTLWSGAFGAHGVNEGTEENWVGLAEVNHTGYVGLEAQNIEAFSLHRLEINDKVLDEYGYRALYDEAFQDFEPEERYTPTTSSFAISAFLRSLLSNKAPFQEYLKGDFDAITESQKKGATLFFGKARCYLCHNNPALASMNFHALGTKDMYMLGGLNTGPYDPRNWGRGMFTGKEEDKYRFKVPQLYNVKDYVTFFHGSSKTSLEDLIDYKIKAQSENPFVEDSRLSAYFRPLNLTEDERAQLLDFLGNALYDPDLERHLPTSVLSGNCFPNNDEMSRSQLGCN